MRKNNLFTRDHPEHDYLRVMKVIEQKIEEIIENTSFVEVDDEGQLKKASDRRCYIFIDNHARLLQ